MKNHFSTQIVFATAVGFLFLILAAAPGEVGAHGVVWEMSAQKAYGLEFGYDDGSPMSYVEIKVFGPDDQTKLRQTGRTDEAGSFAFIPLAEGQWLVTADDGAGHLAQAALTVAFEASGGDGAPAAVNIEREIDKATKPLKIALVISIFIAIAAVWTARRGRKRTEASS